MTHLQIGDKAPEIRTVDQEGNEFELSSLEGKKIILFFYPKDNTPTCTKEACNFRDNFSKLKRKGFQVLGVSPDSERSHRNFAEKFELPFPLLVDQEKTIVNDYGVYGEKKFMGRTVIGVRRTTFVIDEGGCIELIIEKVESKNATEQIFELLEDE